MQPRREDHLREARRRAATLAGVLEELRGIGDDLRITRTLSGGGSTSLFDQDALRSIALDLEVARAELRASSRASDHSAARAILRDLASIRADLRAA